MCMYVVWQQQEQRHQSSFGRLWKGNDMQPSMPCRTSVSSYQYLPIRHVVYSIKYYTIVVYNTIQVLYTMYFTMIVMSDYQVDGSSWPLNQVRPWSWCTEHSRGFCHGTRISAFHAVRYLETLVMAWHGMA